MCSPSTSSTTQANTALAQLLADIVTSQGGDYPLVSFPDGKAEIAVAWLYAHLVVEIHVIQGRSLQLRSVVPGAVAVEAHSISEAMSLLLEVEALRQGRPHPYIQLT